VQIAEARVFLSGKRSCAICSMLVTSFSRLISSSRFSIRP
jgi:hypothetical protein